MLFIIRDTFVPCPIIPLISKGCTVVVSKGILVIECTPGKKQLVDSD